MTRIKLFFMCLLLTISCNPMQLQYLQYNVQKLNTTHLKQTIILNKYTVIIYL